MIGTKEINIYYIQLLNSHREMIGNLIKSIQQPVLKKVSDQVDH